MRDVVIDSGILIEGNEPKALAEQLARALADPVLRARLGAAAHARSVARFSLESVVSEYERLLHELEKR